MTRTSATSPGETPFYAREILGLHGLVNASGTKIADRVYYLPVQIPKRMTIDGIIVIHVAVAAGNLYVAFYNSLNGAPLNRLAVSASTACNGINQRQIVLFAAPVTVNAGLYFLSMEVDNAADTYMYAVWSSAQQTPNIPADYLCCFFEDLGGYLPPPVAATPSNATIQTQTVFMSARVASVP